MRTPDQVRWDFVQDWLRKANSDIEAARILAEEDLDDYEVATFHAQQAAEKLIKAFLVRHQVEFAKTHEIKALRSLVAALDQTLASELSEADELTPYAVEYRYPGDAGGVSQDDAVEALRTTDRVKSRILAALKDYLSAGRPPDSTESSHE
jgi:HEPN domain-containing protein